MHFPCPLFALDITPLPFCRNGYLDKVSDLRPQDQGLDTRHLNLKIPVIRARYLVYMITTLYAQYITG